MNPGTRAALPKIANQRLLWGAGIAVSFLLVIIAIVAWPKGSGSPDSERATSEANSAAPKSGQGDAVPTEVQLTPEKVERSALKLTKAEQRPFRETRAVPGQIVYDGAKHLSITAPVDGVVKRVLAEPGQMIEQGAPLVVMSSTEVGLARDEVLHRIVGLELASQEHDWAETVAENVELLLKWFSDRPKLTEIEAKFDDRPLGDYRERLISTYSKLLLAEQALASTSDLDQQGGLARRVVEERRSNREVAAATFLSAREITRFDATQAHRRSHASLTQAQRLLAVAQERLRTLLGPQASALEARIDDEPVVAPRVTPGASPAEPPAESNGRSAPSTQFKDLSEFTLLAPFTGRIDERSAVEAARVRQGDSLFVMADTSTLWVEAEIHERNWRALRFVQGASIPVRVPALNDASFETALRFVGPSVSSVSRSVPLVTELANPEGHFKPGMFVWVDVPLEQERQALVVPAGAVMRHEGQAFVFIPKGSGKFTRVDVATGLESGSLIEILRGLEAGQEIVEQGAFYLKSELLLERELE